LNWPSTGCERPITIWSPLGKRFCCPTDRLIRPAFTAQQAIEKALKALLTATETPFQRIHDLSRLLDQALPILPALESFREGLATISNYAVDTRYPEVASDPTRQEAIDALAIAEKVMAMIRAEVEPD
jgi:HEPN domain-containing protein